MSRVSNSVSKLTRSMGSTASRPIVDVPGTSLLPKYAELLRNRRTPREQSDAHSHSRQMTTRHVPPPPQTNPINLPASGKFSSAASRTPVPIMFNPMHQQAAGARAGPTHAPEVVFISKNQKFKQEVLEEIDVIDVDEAALKKASL